MRLDDATTQFIRERAVMHNSGRSRAQLHGRRGFTLIEPGTIPLWFFWLGGLLAALTLASADPRRDARVSAAPAPMMP
jgi:hypothetical protein